MPASAAMDAGPARVRASGRAIQSGERRSAPPRRRRRHADRALGHGRRPRLDRPVVEPGPAERRSAGGARPRRAAEHSPPRPRHGRRAGHEAGTDAGSAPALAVSAPAETPVATPEEAALAPAAAAPGRTGAASSCRYYRALDARRFAAAWRRSRPRPDGLRRLRALERRLRDHPGEPPARHRGASGTAPSRRRPRAGHGRPLAVRAGAPPLRGPLAARARPRTAGARSA